MLALFCFRGHSQCSRDLGTTSTLSSTIDHHSQPTITNSIQPYIVRIIIRSRDHCLFAASMVRIKYTGPMAQVQQAPAQTKTQAESEETTRLKIQADLTLKQQQSLEMVQIMLHVSVSSLIASLFLVNQTLTSTLLISSARYFIFGLPIPVIFAT